MHVASVFWALLSSRHSSALYCFNCIVSVLRNRIFIHTFWVRTRLLKLKSGYQCFQSSHHAVKTSPVVSSSRAHLVTQSDCHTVSSVTANLPQARLVTVSWSQAIAQGQQPSCSDGRVRMNQSQSALGTTIKSVVLQVLHMDRPSPFRADGAPCRRHS